MLYRTRPKEPPVEQSLTLNAELYHLQTWGDYSRWTTLQSSRDLPAMLDAMRRGEWPRRVVNDFGREISRCDNGASVVES